MSYQSEKHEHVEVTGGDGERREEISEDAAQEKQNQINKITSIIWLIFGILEAIIGFRVLLKLLAANPANEFANFIYNVSYPFLAPFFGLVGTPSSDGNVLEVPSIIAMLVYLFIAWVIVRFVVLLMTPTKVRHVRTYERH